MPRIDCNKVLPKELVIETIDNFLYEIGLCHQSVSDRTKRSKINSPKLIFTVLSVNLLVSILANFTDDETTLVLLMDFGRYEGIKFFMNMEIITVTCMALFNHLVYSWNHKQGIEPTFLRLFQVMSGSLSPSAVGLTDESQCRSLLKIAKWLTPLHYNSMIFVPIFVSSYVLRAHLAYYGFQDTFIFGTHTLIRMLFWAYYVFNMVTSLLVIFIIICKYFVLKLNKLNSEMKSSITSKTINSRRIRNILHSYDGLYREIDEYNTTYWSQFLFSVWLFFGVFLVIGIYLMIFGNIPFLSRMIFFYVISTMTILYIAIMTIASSVNLEANNSYITFNSFIVKYRKSGKIGYRQIVIDNIKVFFIVFLIGIVFRITCFDISPSSIVLSNEWQRRMLALPVGHCSQLIISNSTRYKI